MVEYIINILKEIIKNHNIDILIQLFDHNRCLLYCSENQQQINFPYDNIKSHLSKEGSLYYLIENNVGKYIKTNDDYIDISYSIRIDNKLYGYLSLIAKKNIYIEKIGSLVLKLIKNKIEYHYLESKWKVKDEYNNAIIRSLTDGFLVLNKQERVTHINDKALKILHVSRDNILGEKLQKVIKSKLQVLEVIKTGKPIINKELIVKLKNGQKIHVLKNAVPVKNEQDEVIAVIDRFKKIKKVHQFVSDMVGSNATFTFKDIIHGESKMKEIIQFAKKISKTAPTILIQGESGTGKELFAHAIHNCSYRQNNPFVIVDCASFPRELIESELFGYVEGAFTGAKRGGRPGKFELANGGSIFLDEIGEMPLELQSKLLRVLQNRKITRIGGNDSLDIDVKVIAATNRDLEEEVKNNNFREDLFYRLNVVQLKIPPLRERQQDLSVLIEKILNKVKKKLELQDIKITKKVQELLSKYCWPGNVRELENVLYSSAIKCNNGLIMIDCLPDKIKNFNKSKEISNNESQKNIKMKNIECNSLKELESKYILKVLEENKGNKKKAAKELGISRSTLYRKLNNIDDVSI
ncbi:MAG: PAS domain-containing protein [Firmicutes bacterium]|nr:PAS domain-containing protein [Bacillota bacterium]